MPQLKHFIFALAIATATLGCGEKVPDIDRTQGNLLAKSDLDGQWYMMQTITDVPTTSWFTFIGETSSMERVRWEIRQDQLVAYRAYPRLRGGESPSANVPFDGTENPIAAYRINAHIDIKREYNPSTGEQSNVISENQSDRQWHERDYIRVDWSRSLVTNFEFIAPTSEVTNAAYFVSEEEGGPDAFYRETGDDGRTQYFDVLGKLFVEPDLWGCIYTWYGFSAEDCTAAEIGVRTSFSRAPEVPDYEAFHYDDQLMSRFGYFRSEYFSYDEQRGVRDQGRRYLIQRHNIWKETFRDGKVIPIPEREIRTVPYYLSTNFPDDPLLMDAAVATMKQWNDGIRDGLTAAGITDETDVFVLCRNPVAEDDPIACGDAGFSPRIGDLRYSTLHWVDPETLTGLLGYGPSAVDPITGEIVSGKAYVYGGAVSTWATYALDVLRYFNGEIEFDSLVRGHHFSDAIVERLAGNDTVPKPAAALREMGLDRPVHGERRAKRPNRRVEDLRPYDRDRVQRRMDAAKEAGASSMLLNHEMKRALSHSHGTHWDEMDDATRDRLDPTQFLNPLALKRRQELRKKARAKTADMHDMIAPDIDGIVRSYAGRTDYDQVWRELRAEIFAATAEHEVGHTLGLRHNFQGSYDSLNYHEEYWDLREENLFAATTLADAYELSTLTDAQKDGQMRQKQYSSIMDYGYSWANDLAGLGKYDRAALVFGYTSGSYAATGDHCENYPSTATDTGCSAQLPGFVQIFSKRKNALGRAGEILDGKEFDYTYDDPGLPSITALERYHYTTVALAFPSLEDMRDSGREWMNYADFKAQKNDEDRAVRVPYLFCSDEWESGLVSCHVFDQGADPFEIARGKIDNYRAYYPFINFRRDNPAFEPWHALVDYYWGVFLPLSDVFQSWYVAPYGFDPLFDRVYDLAIGAGFNLMAEVLSTPPYGTFCEGTENNLIYLSDEPQLQGDARLDPYCADGGEKVVIEPGVGRRRFSTYDPSTGYYFPDKPQEAGHYWATLAAVWALTDPDAYVLGVDGDAGTYAISFYDWFEDEFTELMNNLLTKTYTNFAPRARIWSRQGQNEPVAEMHYRAPISIYNPGDGTYYNPETGTLADAPTGGPKGLCDTCDESSECVGYTGRLGGFYCQPINDDDEDWVCLKDCTNDPSACVEGTRCNDVGNCVPETNCTNLRGTCSDTNEYGACETGTCVQGECLSTENGPLVETEPTFSLATEILWNSFLFTTSSYSTRFNDQLNVFRPGTSSEVAVVDPDAAERITFTDPLTGVSYAAVQPKCPEVEGFPVGGHLGLCSPCEDGRDCAGHTRELDGVYCQPMDDSGDLFCLVDCTNGPENCPAGFVCNGDDNCVPEEEAACPAPKACSPNEPLGECPEASTCVEGKCVSAQCLYGPSGDTGAVQMLRRAEALAQDYQEALSGWYRYDDDPADDARYTRLYYRTQYELKNHVDLLETLLATYQIFGRVY